MIPTRQALPSNSARVTFSKIEKSFGHRTLLYGTGGIGKTTLACMAEGKTAFIDADESLQRLKPRLKELGIEVPVTVEVGDWLGLRAALQSPGWESINNIVIDTVTKVEEWCVAHTVKTVPGEKGKKVDSIEGYGFGKGLQYNFDKFLPLLGDLDRHARAGRNVFLICHDCVSNVPNPAGADWIRYEPRLQNPSSGKASIRLRAKEWADHVLFVGYDVAVDENKKAQGQGSRTLYASELPFCMAKSRTFSGQIDVAHGESPWNQILI